MKNLILFLVVALYLVSCGDNTEKSMNENSNPTHRPRNTNQSQRLNSNDKGLTHCCNYCTHTPVHLRCSRCHCTYYCDQECQKNHWNIHKKECKYFVRANPGLTLNTKRSLLVGGFIKEVCDKEQYLFIPHEIIRLINRFYNKFNLFSITDVDILYKSIDLKSKINDNTIIVPLKDDNKETFIKYTSNKEKISKTFSKYGTRVFVEFHPTGKYAAIKPAHEDYIYIHNLEEEELVIKLPFEQEKNDIFLKYGYCVHAKYNQVDSCKGDFKIYSLSPFKLMVRKTINSRLYDFADENTLWFWSLRFRNSDQVPLYNNDIVEHRTKNKIKYTYAHYVFDIRKNEESVKILETPFSTYGHFGKNRIYLQLAINYDIRQLVRVGYQDINKKPEIEIVSRDIKLSTANSDKTILGVYTKFHQLEIRDYIEYGLIKKILLPSSDICREIYFNEDRIVIVTRV